MIVGASGHATTMKKAARAADGKNKEGENAHPGNRTPVSTVGGYYDTTTPDALVVMNDAYAML